ncbi:MAG: hypothetical protein ACLGI6_17745 [Gammaproteobacteria bacterium]
MNKWLALGALALAACSVQASTPASEAQWISAASMAVEYGRAHGMPVELLVEAGNGLPGHTPMGLMSEAGRCTLVVAARDNPTAERVSAMVERELQDLFLQGAAMHELGHCHRRLRGFPHNEKLLPVVAWIGPVRDWFNRRVRLEEAYADMLEVAWLARFHPERYDSVVKAIVQVRTRFREPRHDTLPWLELALAEGPADGAGNSGDVFQSADRRLLRKRCCDIDN